MLCPELKHSIDNDCVSHAYLIDSFEQAMEFVRELSCKQVDFLLVEKGEKAHILSADIDYLQAEFKYKPYGDIKVGLIKDASDMMPQAQNKLLKTLEEPLPGRVLILCCENFSELLPTILSRCVKITTGIHQDNNPQHIDKVMEFLSLIDNNSRYYQLKSCISFIEEKIDALSFLISLETIVEEKLISVPDLKYRELLLLIEETIKNINQGFSVSYSLKSLCLGGTV